MVSFHAVRVVGSDELGVTVVTLAEDGHGGEYLMFQRDSEEHGDASVYVERRGQGWATRGGVRRCELRRNHLALTVDENAASRLGHESEFAVAFDLPDERFLAIRARLQEVFHGLGCFVDGSVGEPRVSPPPDAFAESLNRLFVNWFGPPRPDDAYSHNIVRDWESHYGFKLPAPLRQYYLRCGENKVLSFARGMFTLPDISEVADGRVVFWMGHEDDRDGAWCGVAPEAMALPDPPVERQVFLNDDETSWVPECRRLSWFILRTMCWQAAWGLPARATARLTPECRDRVAARLTFVAPGEPLDQEIIAHAGEGLAVCLSPTEGLVRVGARTTDQLTEFERELGAKLIQTGT